MSHNLYNFLCEIYVIVSEFSFYNDFKYGLLTIFDARFEPL